MQRNEHVLLSLAAADALGAATEMQWAADIERRYGLIHTYQPGSPFGFEPGEATDDTQMTVATLIGYARAEDPQGVLSALLDWVDAYPPDVGNLTRQALRHRSLLGAFHAWAATGRDNAGNGGLMRVAAAFIAGFRGDALLAEAARITALTHIDPRCIYASVFLCALLEELEAHPAGAYTVVGERALARTHNFEPLPTLAGSLPPGEEASYARRLPNALMQVEHSVTLGLAGTVHSQSGYVLDTLQAAVAHARGTDWLACVQPAVMWGHDSDTVACVVGAIVGARGLEVPAHLLPDLRLGHTWRDWHRSWPFVTFTADLARDAAVGVARRADIVR
ncbi:ADP-ribosylglycohydrolase [Deinobacterium chartae]|uniref:ADP-ribosylglycohydrolase n=1 Tax=Deinobacterium chartae TaxID=521158 RepID=A0A841I5G3_9DEIO|nr:ADP-ribosylglycohydrolase family protein [Deinobacterium chartae]MBB6099688.1 ADP-ribosylglycohydrolase [Deinobacterium chartae]